MENQTNRHGKYEYVGNYLITQKTTAKDKVFKFGHNPNAVEPYATWISDKDDPTNNYWGHYWKDKATAEIDFKGRIEAWRNDIPYDHTLLREPELPETETVRTVQAETLPKGWKWQHYDDGSGSLQSPDGKSYFSYDRQTGEYKNLNGHYTNMPGYTGNPSSVNFKDFIDFAEDLAREKLIDEPAKRKFNIADTVVPLRPEEKIDVEMKNTNKEQKSFFNRLNGRTYSRTHRPSTRKEETFDEWYNSCIMRNAPLGDCPDGSYALNMAVSTLSPNEKAAFRTRANAYIAQYARDDNEDVFDTFAPQIMQAVRECAKKEKLLDDPQFEVLKQMGKNMEQTSNKQVDEFHESILEEKAPLKMSLIGIDSWDRPTYRDEKGRLWLDVNMGEGEPYLHRSTSKDFDEGEPDYPIKEDFEIVPKEEYIDGYRITHQEGAEKVSIRISHNDPATKPFCAFAKDKEIYERMSKKQSKKLPVKSKDCEMEY